MKKNIILIGFMAFVLGCGEPKTETTPPPATTTEAASPAAPAAGGETAPAAGGETAPASPEGSPAPTGP